MNGNSGPALSPYTALILKYLYLLNSMGHIYTTFPYPKIGHTSILYSVINDVLCRVLKYGLISV